MKCPVCLYKFRLEPIYDLDGDMLGIDCPQCGSHLERENPQKYNWIFLVKALAYPALIFLVPFLYGQIQSKLVLGVILAGFFVWLVYVVSRFVKGSKLRPQKTKSI